MLIECLSSRTRRRMCFRLVVLQRKLVSTGALGLGLGMRPQHCEKSCARVAAIRGRWHGQKKAAR